MDQATQDGSRHRTTATERLPADPRDQRAPMANDGRTEKATPKRKREARREGRVARSQELGTALSLLASFIALKAFLPRIVHTYVERARSVWGHADQGLAQ